MKASISLWLDVSPYLLLGMVISGCLHIFLAKDFIFRHLGKGGFSSIIKATALGVPLPVCSCGVIPLASALKREGADKSSVLSFLIATPTTGVDSILATYSLLGPLFMIFRPLAAFLCGITVGLLDYIFEPQKHEYHYIPEEHSEGSFSGRFKEFFRYAFFRIPQDIGYWLIMGTVLGAAIAAFIPAEFFLKYFSAPWDFIAALLMGVPLYVCATGSIPVAASLIQKGFSPGAGLVFLIVGPATNIITLSFVRAKLGRKSFYIYLFSIVAIAIVLGAVFNYFWAGVGRELVFLQGAGAKLPFHLRMVSGIILFGIIANSLWKKRR